MFVSEEEATACLSKLPDLDKLWPMPDEELVATAHRISTAIRMKFGLPDMPMFAAQSPAPQALYAPPMNQAYAPPMGPSAPPYAPVAAPRPVAAYTPPMIPSAPPYAPAAQPLVQPVIQPVVQPSAPPTMAPSPVSYAPPVAVAPAPVPMSAPAPSVVPPVVAPPVQTAAPGVAPPTPGISIEKCAIELLGPKPPADPAMPNRPICFKNMNLISAGPNKAWCDPCPFKVPCKMCSAKGK
jgi:hypothetical protein